MCSAFVKENSFGLNQLNQQQKNSNQTAITFRMNVQSFKGENISFSWIKTRFKKSKTILTEVSKTPRRAVALASYLGKEYSSLGRTPPVNDLMAFGSVLQHTQHNIGNSKCIDNNQQKNI